MNPAKIIVPEFEADHFNCPRCGVHAQQFWNIPGVAGHALADFSISRCNHCEKGSLWHRIQLHESVRGALLWPRSLPAPEPDEGMPDHVRELYQEAREVLASSPRAATALLRLTIEEICSALGHSGKKLNDAIGALVAEGLPAKVQEALDSVRVVGNSAIHPGQINLGDKDETALRLFDLVNVIVRTMITEPAEVNRIYLEAIPQSKRDAIDERDGENRTGGGKKSGG